MRRTVPRPGPQGIEQDQTCTMQPAAPHRRSLHATSHCASATDISRKTFTVGYDYFLSKRTDVYVMAMADRITNQTKGSSFGVGVRHRF